MVSELLKYVYHNLKVTLLLPCHWYVPKLDGVGPVDNRPSTD